MTSLTTNFFMVLFLTLFISCGYQPDEKSDQNNVLSINNIDANDQDGLEDQENQNSNDEKVAEAMELVNKPTFGNQSCNAPFGCLKGYISHGMKLLFKPETLSDEETVTMTNVEGESVQIGGQSFRDSQDFGDRFYKVFIKPLIPGTQSDSYSYQILPTVKRDNFANGFELFSEGLNASDDVVKMEGEGNFNLGDIEPFDKVSLRAVKMFRIEIIRKSDNENSNQEHREITCLEISANLSPKEVVAGKVTNIGGLRNFTFYYTENEDLCKPERLGQNPDWQSTPADFRQLPVTGPNLPL